MLFRVRPDCDPGPEETFDALSPTHAAELWAYRHGDGDCALNLVVEPAEDWAKDSFKWQGDEDGYFVLVEVEDRISYNAQVIEKF